jgi:mRNA-degrading endonuclease RelE of RelBE toxin-antitoxin system
VKSHTTERFRKMLQPLPEQIRRQASEAYKLFKQNPHHPSLRFKQIHPTKPVYSVRINIDYRAVGAREGDDMLWFWIGSHTEYEKLISRL